MAINNLSKDLAPITSNTMADIVEVRLREYLKKKSFRPGDALPKELELAEALDVSRNVLREALSRLRMLGMIETKKKRGMILARPDILGTFERVLDPLIIDTETLQDIFELRLVLEIGLADLIYIRKTDKDIAELESIAKKEVNHDNSFRIKNEIAFHGKLYEMSGNDTLKRFQIMLLPIFDYVVTLEKKPTMGKVNHLDLVQILKTGTKDDFKKGMEAHLKPHFDRLK
ncbi:MULTISPECIES: FadR/GntR family transcriptional regulator [Pedobacter]|uniref:Regulatory protein GntR HTH n=1 Tax=Pedobacter heparinus (strain ATCC 13125 / DSM 2366 / CIP 104194 / JCM 7457 / NBRC 12017 / NCIMB 9290 / NRRL B-14731 / HIM 762-3) TaxID=485917 RepID=C6XY14_PEDHD|nr:MULTISPECIES: GntR family transcriptional regulator [Pedobacter]ACU04432.1 regulatory protein GntR HTH [Pedobacter heparinus DSM 2366]MBB5440723.1 DNA-binding FadR family transcriptional regulator [Pedobacter sp. AK017]